MKALILSVIMTAVALSASAQEYNSQQEQLRTELSKYLYTQGLNPENQPDGIKFKCEGNNYYIEIDKDEKSPMYVRLCRYVKYDERITRDRIMQKINDCNSKIAIKVLCQDKGVVLSAELFITKSSEFTAVYRMLMDLMKKAYDGVKE